MTCHRVCSAKTIINSVAQQHASPALSASQKLDLTYVRPTGAGARHPSAGAPQINSTAAQPAVKRPNSSAKKRPGSSKTQAAEPSKDANEGLPVGEALTEEETSIMSIKLKDLSLKIPDPYMPLHKQWAEELAAAQAAGTPVAFTLLPPPQPFVYHFELCSCEEDGGGQPGASLQRLVIDEERETQEQGQGEDGSRQDMQSAGSDACMDAQLMQGKQMGEAGSQRSHSPQTPSTPHDAGNGFGGGLEGTTRPEGMEGSQFGGPSEQDLHSQADGSPPPSRQAEEAEGGAAPASRPGTAAAEGEGGAGRNKYTMYASIPLLLEPPEPPVSELDAPKVCCVCLSCVCAACVTSYVLAVCVCVRAT